MIYELLYTSAPAGLRPGSSGYCTVQSSRGIPAPTVELLESLSGYRHHFKPGTAEAQQNPVNYGHYVLRVQGRNEHILSRVSDCPLDHTGRSNKLAHHMVVHSATDIANGPAWLLGQPGWMIERWDGDVRVRDESRQPPTGARPLSQCRAWEQATGDAGWAGVVAGAFLADPTRKVFFICPPETNLLPLFEEALSLLPAARRWDVTFSTYSAALPSTVDCIWSGIIAGSKEEHLSKRFINALRIDLPKPLGHTPETSDLVQVARTGVLPQPIAVTTGPNESVQANSTGPIADTESEKEGKRTGVPAAGKPSTTGVLKGRGGTLPPPIPGANPNSNLAMLRPLLILMCSLMFVGGGTAATLVYFFGSSAPETPETHLAQGDTDGMDRAGADTREPDEITPKSTNPLALADEADKNDVVMQENPADPTQEDNPDLIASKDAEMKQSSEDAPAKAELPSEQTKPEQSPKKEEPSQLAEEGKKKPAPKQITHTPWLKNTIYLGASSTALEVDDANNNTFQQIPIGSQIELLLPDRNDNLPLAMRPVTEEPVEMDKHGTMYRGLEYLIKEGDDDLATIVVLYEAAGDGKLAEIEVTAAYDPTEVQKDFLKLCAIQFVEPPNESQQRTWRIPLWRPARVPSLVYDQRNLKFKHFKLQLASDDAQLEVLKELPEFTKTLLELTGKPILTQSGRKYPLEIEEQGLVFISKEHEKTLGAKLTYAGEAQEKCRLELITPEANKTQADSKKYLQIDDRGGLVTAIYETVNRKIIEKEQGIKNQLIELWGGANGVEQLLGKLVNTPGINKDDVPKVAPDPSSRIDNNSIAQSINKFKKTIRGTSSGDDNSNEQQDSDSKRIAEYLSEREKLLEMQSKRTRESDEVKGSRLHGLTLSARMRSASGETVLLPVIVVDNAQPE